MDLTEKAVEFIRTHRGTTFVELEKFAIENGMEPKGKICLEAAKYDNIFVWFNVSEEFADLISSLRSLKEIKVKPAHLLSYFVDGSVPDVPIAKRARSYKEPRWFPVAFYVHDKK